MAVFDYPIELAPETVEWVNLRAGVQFKSPFNGWTESVDFLGERWAVSLGIQPFYAREGGRAEAFFGRLAGGMDRVRLWHFMRPQPRGTMRGTPTLSAPAARGDQTLQIVTDGTLLAGDMFKSGNQLFQAFQDCEPSGGVLTVQLVQRVRSALAIGSAVLWDKPTALFVMPAMSNRSTYTMGQLTASHIDLEEVYE